MAWIKRDTQVEVREELEYESSSITVTNAYECEVTEAYLKESADDKSKSLSLVIGVKTDAGENARSFFTVLGRDGESYFTKTINGKTIKMQHIGLSIVNTLFGIALGKEIFDCEPSDVTYEQYNKDTKSRDEVTGDGFPDLIGKRIGTCIQMNREINGADSKEYSSIEHFFDIETGLFYKEEESENTKLNKWLKSAKDFKVKEAREVPKSSFGGKSKAPDKEASADAPVKKGWGR